MCRISYPLKTLSILGTPKMIVHVIVNVRFWKVKSLKACINSRYFCLSTSDYNIYLYDYTQDITYP